VLVSVHPLYRALAGAAVERQRAYRALFRPTLDAGFVDALRAATNGGWALGNARFEQRIAKALKRRVAPLPKGRPRRATQDRRQLNLL
jgi:putative transposase